MKLYLVRHGDAVLGHLDPARPLSRVGEEQIEYAAKFLARQNLHIAHIYHSGILRAEQTAKIIAERISLMHCVEKKSGLAPDDSVDQIVGDVNVIGEDIMLVGHLPYLGLLVSELILRNKLYSLVNFETGSIVCLERMSGHWFISWVLNPILKF